MKFIFLIAAFNAFFFTVLSFQKKPRALHDSILIGWLTYLGAYIGVYAFYSHVLFTHFQLLSISLMGEIVNIYGKTGYSRGFAIFTLLAIFNLMIIFGLHKRTKNQFRNGSVK